MNNICELKQQFISLKREFNENVQDKFGNSINEEILELTLNSFNLLCLQEEKIKAEKIIVNKHLLEAKSIIPLI